MESCLLGSNDNHLLVTVYYADVPKQWFACAENDAAGFLRKIRL